MPKESLYRLTGELPEIDIRRWRRSGHLEPGNRFLSQWYDGDKPYAGMRVHVESYRLLWLSYRFERRGRAEDMLYPILIDWTVCHLGGERPWFMCPNPECQRRCAILYQGQIFQCRRCMQLRYPSQREPSYDRLARRAENIRHRLGWTPGILAGPEKKPRHMHWRTFLRLLDTHEQFVEVAVSGAKPLQKAGGLLM